METDAQATDAAWAAVPHATPADSNRWMETYIGARWRGVPPGTLPGRQKMLIQAVIAFASLPWRGPPLAPVEELRLEELLALYVTGELGPGVHFMDAARPYRDIDTSTLNRVLAYIARLIRSPHEVAMHTNYLELIEFPHHLFFLVGFDEKTDMAEELYRRDVAVYGVYQRSGAPRHLDSILRAGPYSPLQYLVASFLSPRIRSAPPLVHREFPDNLFVAYNGSLPAALPVDVRSLAQRQADAAAVRRQFEQMGAASGSKRGHGGDSDEDSNKKHRGAGAQ